MFSIDIDRRGGTASLILALGLPGLLLTACDGSDAKPASQAAATADAQASPSTGPDACDLIPRAELEQILASSLRDPEPGQPFTTGDSRITTCGWRTEDGRAGVVFGLRRGPQYKPDPHAFDHYAAGFEENMGTRPQVQRTPGLGSAALWDATNHVLLVRPRQRGSEISVQPYLGTTVPMIELPQARSVAEAALRRLD
jgi:hypothetical protein